MAEGAIAEHLTDTRLVDMSQKTVTRTGGATCARELLPPGAGES